MTGRRRGRPRRRPARDGGPASVRPGIPGRAGSSRVEPSLHTVARGENFWTISRLYYGDGRYYRALWKANSRKYPNIDELHINDVILIPAPEDLDPALIGQPRTRPVAGRDEGSTRDEDGSDGSTPAESKRLNSFPTTRTARTSDAARQHPGRRPGRADAELRCRSATPMQRACPGRPRTRLRPSPSKTTMTGTATRLTARPRNPAPVDRPVYKVRRYDTLRSIARDALGDPIEPTRSTISTATSSTIRPA